MEEQSHQYRTPIRHTKQLREQAAAQPVPEDTTPIPLLTGPLVLYPPALEDKTPAPSFGEPTLVAPLTEEQGVEHTVKYSRRTIQIFCSYARKDKAFHDEIVKQLDAFKRSGLITVWHDQEIAPGTDWEKQIDKHLREADIILLLLSPDFIHSDYCYGREMQLALKRHEAEEVHVIPILLRHVHWEETPLRKLQVLPSDAKPLAAWKDLDEALYQVADEIGKVAKELTAQKERDYWISKGKQEIEAREYDEGERSYAKVLELFPDHPENGAIYRDRGNLLKRMARYHNALEMYQKAVKLDANNSQLYQALGDVLTKLSRDEEALDAYNQAIALDPQNPRILQSCGDLYRNLLRDEEALNSYNRALDLDSDNILLLFNKGYLLNRLGRHTEACDTYQKALDQDPTNVALALLLGKTYYELKKYDFALKAYDHALTLDATSALAYYGRGIVLEKFEDSPGREKEIRQAYMMANIFGHPPDAVTPKLEAQAIDAGDVFPTNSNDQPDWNEPSNRTEPDPW